ncbi:hypothetical protein [Robertkochia sediminum]|uniref:hypothetical protein n=1 Tax=Robertkochia sediminum TaxID=2785326 RepID=UPI001932B71F|nr:hypothetical protein [Robertkochia sediminum]MBL7471402.1 hypothetical protein [Robertkochia sediminum]
MIRQNNFTFTDGNINDGPLGELSCSNCDFSRYRSTRTVRLHTVEYHPVEGVLPSLIQYCYCQKCEDLTPWFMGSGFVHFEVFRGHLEKIGVLEEQIVALKKKYNTSSVDRRSGYFRRRRSETRPVPASMSELQELEHQLKELRSSPGMDVNVSESEKFYEDLKPAPRCLGCGHKDALATPFDHWQEVLLHGDDNREINAVHFYAFPIVKHSCGGQIVFKKGRKDRPIHVHRFYEEETQRRITIHEYDQWGKVVNTIEH